MTVHGAIRATVYHNRMLKYEQYLTEKGYKAKSSHECSCNCSGPVLLIVCVFTFGHFVF